MSAAKWLDEARETPLLGAAKELGMETAAGMSLRPCPACGAANRHLRDKRRGPISLYLGADGRERWSCKRGTCGVGGDVVDLVAVALSGGPAKLSETAVCEQVRGWFGDRNGVPMRTVVEKIAPRPRPPSAEVEALWDACMPVNRTMVPPSIVEMWPSFFLMDRKFHPMDLAPLDLVRITPPDHEWPAWWPRYWARDFRLVVRAFEPDGSFASLHARAVPMYDNSGALVRPPERKTSWPLGCSATGLLFADGPGQRLLREGVAPVDGVIVVEGVTDFIRASLVAAELRHRVAVLGAAAGGFRALAEVRWPADTHVFTATDADKVGDEYAAEVQSALAALPVHVHRLDPRNLGALHGQ